uniref:Protein jagunal homolog 1-like n=1 Tax=Rhizophora mucronata TaxID=61149 RepID=A0A2P2J6Q6_RHIMU
MHSRKPGRPSGTDGSDFSYRMVVDSRYTKVAKGKSRLCSLILTQAAIQLTGLAVLSTSNGSASKLAISSAVAGLICLLIGEFGRRRSRTGFLRVYIAASSVATLLSLFCALSSNSMLEAIQNRGEWENKKLDLVEAFLLLLRFLVQVFTIGTVFSLIDNMSPPKKAY